VKRIWLIIALSFWHPTASAGIRAFACEPEWGALLEELGGEYVAVYTATTALQDVHHIQARPSLIAQVRRADLVVCTGAELEVGWLPVLLRRANNPKVQPGTSGYLEAADYVTLLEKPERLDRALGDVHAQGNPHLHLNPHNILKVARGVTSKMEKIDPANAETYKERHADFERRWTAAISRWKAQAETARGMPIVVHHRSWVYLNDWLGLQELAALEPQPGVPPTSGHLKELLVQMQSRPARMIIRAPYVSERASKWLSKRTGIPAIVLPYTVGGNEAAMDLFSLFDNTVAQLIKYSS